MAKQTKKKTSRSKNTQNSNPLLSIEALAVFLIVYCLLAIFQLGFLGKFFANVIRFFIGDLFVFGGVCGILAGFGMLFRGRMPKIIWRWTVAAVCSSIALLLFVSVMTYSSFTSSGSPLFQEMMNRFMVDFTSNTISQNLGGGLIGTLLYAGTYFLVSQWGTYLLVFLLLVSSALLIFDIHLSDVMNFVRTHVSNLSQKIAEKKAEKEAKQKSLEEERGCYLISFSTGIETMDLSSFNSIDGITNLVKFLRMSFNGGTDANPALNHSVKLLEEKEWKNADVLMISDFVMGTLDSELEEKIKAQQKKKCRFFSLAVTSGGNNAVISTFDKNWIYDTNSRDASKKLVRQLEEINNG